MKRSSSVWAVGGEGQSPAQGEGTIRNDLPLPVWSKDNDVVKAITEEDLAELHFTKVQ